MFFSVRPYRGYLHGHLQTGRVSGVIDPVLLCNEMPELCPGDYRHRTQNLGEVFTGTLCCSAAAQCRTARCRKTLTEALQNLRNAHTCEAAEDALKDAQNMMASLSTGKGVIQPVHIDDVLPEVVDRVECRKSGTGEIQGADDRYLMNLDAKTGGMEPGDLVFIAARPSMGKNRTCAGHHRQGD